MFCFKGCLLLVWIKGHIMSNSDSVSFHLLFQSVVLKVRQVFCRMTIHSDSQASNVCKIWSRNAGFRSEVTLNWDRARGLTAY